MKNLNITIVGAGNLGMAIYNGLSRSGFLENNVLTLTRKNIDHFSGTLKHGASLTDDNKKAVHGADVIIICVQPKQMEEVVLEIRNDLAKNSTVVSAATGVSIDNLAGWLVRPDITVIRAMPNTAIAIGESMTCLAGEEVSDKEMKTVGAIFNQLGKTMIIPEHLLQAATIICASGTAFWMRFIRATCQGAVQLGFEADVAQELVMQTCLGGAKLLAHNGTHPEQEIDKVTTPGGCTVKGLNEMEHQGLSSAIIKGLETSYDQINRISKQST